MIILNIYVFLLFLGGLLCIIISYNHILVIILSLEFLILGIFISLRLRIGGGINNCILIILYLFVVVCEGSLGLGLLVSLVRGYGGDICHLLILLRC